MLTGLMGLWLGSMAFISFSGYGAVFGLQLAIFAFSGGVSPAFFAAVTGRGIMPTAPCVWASASDSVWSMWQRFGPIDFGPWEWG